MSDKSQKGCQNVRVWSYIVGIIYAVACLMATILLIATLGIYHRKDIQEDKREGTLGSTSLSGYIVALLIAVWSFACAVLMMRGINAKRTNFILPFIFWNALIIVVSIFGSVVQYVIDLVHKKPLVLALTSFSMEFTMTTILFLMLVPVVLQYNNLKKRPYSAHLQTA